jgi:DNA-binding HxlR family transcriptional regulator
MASRFCPRYHHAVELIGKRWTGAILRAMFAGASRFGEMAAAVPDLSDRMLSERLKELEAEGVVERVVHAETPVRIEYRLTDKGRALQPVVDELAAWAERWIDDVPLATPSR